MRRRGAFSLYWNSNAFALLLAPLGLALYTIYMICTVSPSQALKRFLIHPRIVPGDSITRPKGSNIWNCISFTLPRFMNKKRFNERSRKFPLGQQTCLEATFH
jgi:hypothetical protein